MDSEEAVPCIAIIRYTDSQDTTTEGSMTICTFSQCLLDLSVVLHLLSLAAGAGECSALLPRVDTRAAGGRVRRGAEDLRTHLHVPIHPDTDNEVGIGSSRHYRMVFVHPDTIRIEDLALRCILTFWTCCLL